MIRHPLFIVGMPRSGTTLLSSILDAHSDIVISPETHFYTRCQPHAEGDEGAIERVWARLQQQPGIQDMALSESEKSEIWRRVHSRPDPGPADLLRAIETTYANRFDVEAWGEKTPDHLMHVPVILDDFPEAVVLAVVRDPRDVCSSLRDMPWSRDSLPESAWKWHQYAERTEHYETTYPDRFREVRYEDLLEDAETVIRQILTWIEAPYEKGILDFHEREAAPVDPGREPWKQKTRRPIDPSNKEKWRQSMPVGARILVERIAASMMGVKGYEPAADPVGPFALIDVLREIAIAAGDILRRIWRQWRMPTRSTGNHTPVWMREKTVFSDEKD